MGKAAMHWARTLILLACLQHGTLAPVTQPSRQTGSCIPFPRTAVVAGQHDLWWRRVVTVTNPLPNPQRGLVAVSLADLHLPEGTRLESLRVIDPAAQQRVRFEVDLDCGLLRWLADLAARARRSYEVYASEDPDLLPVEPGAMPSLVTLPGERTAGNRGLELAYRGPQASLCISLQDHGPYDPDVTQTHNLPLTEGDERWMRELWRRRIGLSSFCLGGRELVASHWPGYWSALSYYYDGRPYQLSRLDCVSVRRGALSSHLVAQGAAENYAYGWGRGLRVGLEMRLQPPGSLWVRWTLTAEHDMEVVPETGQPPQPVGQVSMRGVHFLPEFIAPAFNRALWHDEKGQLQRADIIPNHDQVFLSGRPGGPGWCALYDTDSQRLLGLIPEQWGDGGYLLVASHDAEGYPRDVLQMRMVGQPTTNWKAGESHTWSYWLIVGEGIDEEQAVVLMERARMGAQAQWRITVSGG